MTFKLPKSKRIKVPGLPSYDATGATYKFPSSTGDIMVIASFDEGWEHVSASLFYRCPTWNEMCMVKDFFWGEEDTVIQYHPAKSEYINCHPYCLHLWRPMDLEILCPPKWMIGPVTGIDP